MKKYKTQLNVNLKIGNKTFSHQDNYKTSPVALYNRDPFASLFPTTWT